MDNNEIKKANRKALPKFMLIMAISLLAGGAIGFCSAKYGLNKLAGGMESAGAFFGTYIAPWLMLMIAAIVPVVCVLVYGTAKKLLTSWDGENEEISDTVDKRLSIVIWITSATFILSYFLIAASYSVGFETYERENHIVLFFIGIAAFSPLWLRRLLSNRSALMPPRKRIRKKQRPFMT